VIFLFMALPFFVDSAPEPTGSRRATLTLYFNIDRDIPRRTSHPDCRRLPILIAALHMRLREVGCKKPM
jgi:hypothetical protein